MTDAEGSDALLSAVFAALQARGGDDWLSRVEYERVTIGDAAVLVELGIQDGTEDRSRMAGLAHRPPGPIPDSRPWEAKSPVRFVQGMLEGPGPSASDDDHGGDESSARLPRAVGIATLNALSEPWIDWREGDPMALLDPTVETIVTVGLFRPAFRKFGSIEVRVIERAPVENVTAPDRIDLGLFSPAETEAAMDGADVVFITGSTLVYGGIEQYLAAAPKSATVVCVGATASLLPAPLFDAGIDVIAGADVVDSTQARAAVREGACGTDLHERGVRKVYVARDQPSGLDVEPGADEQ